MAAEMPTEQEVARLLEERRTAGAEGEVVVLLIGMRINRFAAVRSWLPVMTGMLRMLRELEGDREAGLLWHRRLTASPREYTVVQYWESAGKLLAYASDRDKRHHPARADFYRRARRSRGRVGIWHETYVVPAGSHESIYWGMPPYGLSAAHGAVPLARRGLTAGERLGR
ncbi:DUF4188 domain-containing protein [Streptomyces sp. NPDC059506]|uniref:DUF4188 domain-containing protein n=1 Tax=Streptomyces sp. NPDC059506 TaxID=3347751 RepID=UPI0036C45F0E